MEREQAQAVIRAELKRKVQKMVNDLAELDAVIKLIGLKGTQTDANLRTACIALNVASKLA